MSFLTGLWHFNNCGIKR